VNKCLARGFLAFCDILKKEDLKNKNQWPNEKEPTLFLCSKKLGSLASETYTIGTQRSAVTVSKKRKQKKI